MMDNGRNEQDQKYPGWVSNETGGWELGSLHCIYISKTIYQYYPFVQNS